MLDHEDGEVRVMRNAETVLVVTEKRVQPQLGLENTGKPDDAKVSRPVCAVRRSVVSLAQPGRTWRNVLGSNGLPNAERPMGTRACQQRSDQPEGVDGDVLLDTHDMGKATLLED